MTTLAFLGAGNIAQAIIGGLLEDGFSPGAIWAADPSETQLEKTAIRGVQTTSDNEQAVQKADIVILSVKPDVVKQIATSIKTAVQGKLCISVAAGVTTESLGAWLSINTVIRCMPNTPALVQMGMTGLFATAAVSQEQRQVAESILKAIGEVRWFDTESDLDAVTAVSGSGPAYFFYVIEVMQIAAEKLGLSPDESKQLVLQTALGAAKMASQSDLPIAELRRNVTSPGGTTEAALKELFAADLEAIFLKALKAAKERSEAL